MPPEFWQGIEQFNQAEFYACHDTLEALWMEAGEPNKRFYQGILQIAVGCYHLSHQNLRGAAILLGEGINRLSGYTPEYNGVDVEELLQQSYQLLAQVQQTSPEQVGDLLQQLQTNLETDSVDSGSELDSTAREGLSPIAFPKIQLVSAPAEQD